MFEWKNGWFVVLRSFDVVDDICGPPGPGALFGRDSALTASYRCTAIGINWGMVGGCSHNKFGAGPGFV